MNNDLAANALTFDNGYDDLFRLHDATKEGISEKKDLRMEKKDGNGCLTAVVGSCDGSKMRCY